MNYRLIGKTAGVYELRSLALEFSGLESYQRPLVSTLSGQRAVRQAS